MKYIADFHIHSKYSRATSRDCIPEMLDLWARRKGLDLIGTGDFTHPAWREELREKLQPAEEGLYTLKEEYRVDHNTLSGIATTFGSAKGYFDAAYDSGHCRPRFVLSAEISSIYKKNDKVRKIHNVILLPDLEAADVLSAKLEQIGNLHADGRPILGLDSRDLLEITLEICPQAIFIPAHIWTPHFSLFGAYSGFDHIEECFEDLTPHIHALETGLSSDPPMNWRLSALDHFTLVSNSDAHSPSKLAREANLFQTDLSYPAIAHALSHPETEEFVGTLEFYPEEGKYHFDGHRNCKVCLTPTETLAAHGVCPVCGRRITVGVLHRVEELADRQEGYKPTNAKQFESIIPLTEAVAASVGATASSKKSQMIYEDLIREMGSELYVLRQAPLEEITRLAGPCTAEGIRRIRAGEVKWNPGYDGEYGRVMILEADEISFYSGQMSLFSFNLANMEKISSARKEETALAQANEKVADRARKTAAPEDTGVGTTPLGGEKQLAGEIWLAGVAPLKGAVPLKGGKQVAGEKEHRLGKDQAGPENSANCYGLNEPQWEAVTAPERTVEVVAGPGTGKTRTLVYHIKYLLEECGTPPASVTAVTFTNKAALEMRQRLEQELDDKKAAKKVNIGTFHSLCLKLLTNLWGEVTLLNETEALFVAEEVKAELNVNTAAREILRFVSDRKNGIERIGKAEIAEDVADLYQQKLAEYQALDYDDLILKTLEYFESDEAEAQVAKERKKFSKLLVDEFQDINQVQYRLIQAWRAGNEQLFVIGDPDQSIYGFRGSDPRCFQTLMEDDPQCRQIRLNMNYRSTPQIVNCGQAIIKALLPCLNGGERSLAAQRANGRNVKVMTAETSFSEALYVAKEINRLVGGIDMRDTDRQDREAGREKAPGFSDIAILYRTHRQSALLEECLKKEGIPYVVTGREKFLTDRQVRTALAFFRFLLNPQDKAAARLMTMGLGQQRSAKLAAIFKERAIGKEKPAKLLDIWIMESEAEDVNPLLQLRGMAVCHKNMPEFLDNLTLGQEGDLKRSGSKVYRADAVSLMTFHGAKGLEFPIVFLCGIKEGTVPLQPYAGFFADEHEERRLFYVGITRAQDELILLTSKELSPFLTDIPKQCSESGIIWKRQTDAEKQLSLF